MSVTLLLRSVEKPDEQSVSVGELGHECISRPDWAGFCSGSEPPGLDPGGGPPLSPGVVDRRAGSSALSHLVPSQPSIASREA